MKGRTLHLPALMLCNWATETLRCANASCAEEENDEIVSPLVKWKRMFSASRVTSVERRKNIGLTIFLKINSHEAFVTVDSRSLRDVCHLWA